jgi:cytochrome oxidase Cu insertion factor (SCO1/SenC/PrrC family)
MKGRRFTRRTAWSVAGTLAFFTAGLGGGIFLSHHIFTKKDPLPPEGQQHLHSTVAMTDPEKPLKIPWADPYPAHPFALTDQGGNQVSLQGFSGKVVLVSFIYTNCKTICPLITQELKKLQQDLGPLMGREVFFLSITIDPKRDTPEALRRYGEGQGVDFRSWKFLTGPEENIREVLEAYRVPVRVEKVPGASEESYELGHENPIYLVDQWGRVRKRTAPTMLVQSGRQAVEYLVQVATSDVSVDEDLEDLRARRSN